MGWKRLGFCYATGMSVCNFLISPLPTALVIHFTGDIAISLTAAVIFWGKIL